MLRNTHIITLIVVMSLVSCMHAQSNLDSLYSLLDHISRGSMISVDEGEIITIGNGSPADTFPGLGVFFVRLSTSGAVLSQSSFFEEGKLRFFDNLNDVCIRDSLAYTFVSGTSPQYVLIYNKFSGVLLDSVPVPSAFDPQGSILPVSLHRIDPNRLLLCAQATTNNVVETQLTVFNMHDMTMTHIRSSLPGFDEHIKDAHWIDGHIYMAGYVRSGSSLSENFRSMTTVVKMDTSGQVIWRYLSPPDSLRIFTTTAIVNQDGIVLVAQNFVRRYDLGNGVFRHVSRPGFAYINSDGALLWEKRVGAARYSSTSILNDVIECQDNTGFIGIGVQSNYDFSDYQLGLDTLPDGRPLQDDAIVVKISKAGAIQWTRNYSRSEGLFTNDRLKDIVDHPAGGYLISGDVAELSGDKPLVRTWLLHIDEYGCVVPGCHLPSATITPKADSITMLLYPNPASDHLNVFVRTEQSYTRYSIRIFDSLGHVVYERPHAMSELTYILDISDFLPGKYFIQLIDGHSILKTSGFVVQR